jgi:integrase/recombinase XerD
MNAIVLAQKASDWNRLKALVLDSVSSPITKRVYNLGLDEFFEWFGKEPRPGFTKATVSAWRVALEARGLGSISINVRITAVRKLAVEAADNGLLAPELAAGITRIKGVRAKGVRIGNWLSMRQAQTLLNTPDATTTWTKVAIDGWTSAGGLTGGPVFRPVGRRDTISGERMSEKVVWQLLRPYAEAAGLAGIAPHDLRRSCAKMCRAAGGDLEQIQLLLGHASVQTTERYLGTKHDLVNAPNDGIRLRVAGAALLNRF